MDELRDVQRADAQLLKNAERKRDEAQREVDKILNRTMTTHYQQMRLFYWKDKLNVWRCDMRLKQLREEMEELEERPEE